MYGVRHTLLLRPGRGNLSCGQPVLRLLRDRLGRCLHNGRLDGRANLHSPLRSWAVYGIEGTPSRIDAISLASTAGLALRSRPVGCDPAPSFDHARTTSYQGSSQLWCWSGLSFGRLFGAHLVHKTLQMGYFCATERALSDSKQMKRGVYEQGREN